MILYLWFTQIYDLWSQQSKQKQVFNNDIELCSNTGALLQHETPDQNHIDQYHEMGLAIKLTI